MKTIIALLFTVVCFSQAKPFDKKTDTGLKYEILTFENKEFVKSGVTSDTMYRGIVKDKVYLVKVEGKTPFKLNFEFYFEGKKIE